MSPKAASCTPGDTQECYTGKDGTQNKGACKAGKSTCDSSGEWGKCEGEVLPTTETCDGQDNNCNGKVDEDLKGEPCAKAQGVCAGLLQQCGGAKGWLKCTNDDYKAHNKNYAADETGSHCDTQDNDCDGKTDEGCECKDGDTQECGASSQGECKKGTQTCSAGQWGKCEGEAKPTQEICDGKDNDCNGQIDNGNNLCPSGQTCQGTKGCQASGPTPILTGTFVNASYKVSGTVAIYKDSQGERVELGPTFKSDAGPDLKVYLTTDPKGNASVGSFINLGVLQKTSGSHTYRLPAGKSSSGYKAIVIWSQRFSANFGYATLK